VVALTALVAGLGPAFLGARSDLTETLGEGGRGAVGGRTLRRWGAALVFAEVALTMVLVVAASFMIRTYTALASEELGYDAGHAVRAALFIEEGDVALEDDPRPLYDRVLAEVAAEPGVEAVGLVFPTVPIVRPIVQSVRWPGMPETLDETGVRAGYFSADAGFFEALRVPRVAGRGFLPTDDDDSAPVALVSEALARRIAPTGEPADAVGREIRIGSVDPDDPDDPPPAVRIAGVVGDVRFGGPREDEAHAYEVYRPLSQDPRRLVSVTVRAGGDPEALVEPIRRRVATVAPASAIDWNETFGGLFRSYFWADTRFFLSLLGIFSGIGLLLSAVGLYAVLADGVARSRRELGLRQALGATPGSILARVLGRGLATVAAGLAAGSLVAWSASESLGSLVYGVAPSDPGPYAAAGATLLAVAFAACWLPARRAAKVAPMDALREE
jgi:predicted permease